MCRFSVILLFLYNWFFKLNLQYRYSTIAHKDEEMVNKTNFLYNKMRFFLQISSHIKISTCEKQGSG